MSKVKRVCSVSISKFVTTEDSKERGELKNENNWEFLCSSSSTVQSLITQGFQHGQDMQTALWFVNISKTDCAGH
jgi:hypothetical protein